MPYLAILVIFHPTLRRIYESLRPISARIASPKLNGNNTYISVAEGNARLEQRVGFDFGFAFIYLSALHGFSVFKIVPIVFTNYCIATRLPRKFVPVATWGFNIGILFANELSDGYRFESLAHFISPKGEADINNGALLHSLAGWMDTHSGIVPRWEILFNLTVLRLISFNLDYYWSLEKGAGSEIEVCYMKKVVCMHLVLMRKRRNSSTPRIFQSEIASLFLLQIRTITSETTLHMRSMPLYIWQDQFSHSMITFLSQNIVLLA